MLFLLKEKEILLLISLYINKSGYKLYGILRKFADSWNGSGEAENAPLLTKQIETFSTVELLFNIGSYATLLIQNVIY